MISNNTIYNHQVAICHECNLTVNIKSLREGQKAACPRCRYIITRVHKNAVDRMLAFSLTAMIFLLLGNSFSFVTLNVQGQQREILLLEIVQVLFAMSEWILAVFLLVVIIGIPIFFTVSLFWLVMLIKLKLASRRTILLLRIIDVLRFWNMAEIFFLGILVSMIKVVSLADVSFGISFWAYALFSLFLIAALLHVDKFQLAHTIRQITADNGVVNSDAWPR